MTGVWHDINDLGLAPEKAPEQGGQDLIVESAPDSVPEIRLVSAQWIPGVKGFLNNEECFLDVKIEYLKETVRSRITGKLFGIYKEEKIDLNQEVEGFIDRATGIARLKIKGLWFINDEHYADWLDDPTTQSQYIVESIIHSTGENNLDSPILDVPWEAPVFIFSL